MFTVARVERDGGQGARNEMRRHGSILPAFPGDSLEAMPNVKVMKK